MVTTHSFNDGAQSKTVCLWSELETISSFQVASANCVHRIRIIRNAGRPQRYGIQESLKPFKRKHTKCNFNLDLD